MPALKPHYSTQFPTPHSSPRRDSRAQSHYQERTLPSAASVNPYSPIPPLCTPPSSPTHAAPSPSEHPVLVALPPGEVTTTFAVTRAFEEHQHRKETSIILSGATTSVFLEFCNQYLSPRNYRYPDAPSLHQDEWC